MGDLRCQKVEKPLQLVAITAESRREGGRILSSRRLDRTYVELKLVAVTLDAAEHAHGVAFCEARVEQVDVLPDSALDPAARVDELEREIVRPAARAQPFRAVRYDEPKAGPLESLVAPPYDVLGPAEREAYLARSRYNVVHLTLPDDYERAGRLWRAWLDEGVLVREEAPSLWWLSQ